MSVYTNQTNANATTTFYSGGAGGSNFPSGISVGNTPPFLLKNGGDAVDALQVQNGNTSDNGYIQIGGAQINPNGQNGLQLTPTSINGLASNTYSLTPFMTVVNPNLTNPSFSLSNISSVSGNMTTIGPNPYYNPLRFDLRPDLSANGGQVEAIFNWDAQNTGANVACVIGANSQTAYMGAVWEGYITMPLQLYGATIDLLSDNETFFHMDGKAGAIGNISTGCGFISGSNQFSSVMSADTQSVANMDALLSTLKSTYPQCFLP